mmetsp:Transcript_43885/g.122003  ORF Transcript_43885/g.122003 Transcript_43885/m.122003 type:complete len:322 (-) Transcript_43885:107-1072(-)
MRNPAWPPSASGCVPRGRGARSWRPSAAMQRSAATSAGPGSQLWSGSSRRNASAWRPRRQPEQRRHARRSCSATLRPWRRRTRSWRPQSARMERTRCARPPRAQRQRRLQQRKGWPRALSAAVARRARPRRRLQQQRRWPRAATSAAIARTAQQQRSASLRSRSVPRNCSACARRGTASSPRCRQSVWRPPSAALPARWHLPGPPLLPPWTLPGPAPPSGPARRSASSSALMAPPSWPASTACCQAAPMVGQPSGRPARGPPSCFGRHATAAAGSFRPTSWARMWSLRAACNSRRLPSLTCSWPAAGPAGLGAHGARACVS